MAIDICRLGTYFAAYLCTSDESIVFLKNRYDIDIFFQNIGDIDISAISILSSLYLFILFIYLVKVTATKMLKCHQCNT
jgi:hypothetical protein